MAGNASKLFLLTLLPVLALGAPYGDSTTSAQSPVTVTVTNNACGGAPSSCSSSHVPTNPTGHTSSSVPISSSIPTSASTSNSAQPTQNSCGQWVVPGTGTFANMSVFTFSGNSLPAGLSASDYEVDDQSGGAPYNHVFQPANVAISGGYLNLKVPGGQKPNKKTAISSAEVVTNAKILYGSIRTNAILSTVPGTCQASFFYQSDTQEIDIEYLTNTSSTSNPGLNHAPWLQYSNQATHSGQTSTYASGPAPANVSTLHEYRVDWTPGRTVFFLDGVPQQTFTTNVPSKAGPWVWNNWANGDPNWTVGPPVQDSVYKIRDITIYYNVPGQTC